jgi:hypothetical protein
VAVSAAKLDMGWVPVCIAGCPQCRRGDSGGPLVNERGELIAVTQGAFTDTHTGSVFIDVSEVKLALQRYAAEKGVRLDLPAGPAVESIAGRRDSSRDP